MIPKFIIVGTLVVSALCNSQQTFQCHNGSDCSYLGVCNTSTSKCECFGGWYGDNCGYLNISSIFPNNFYHTNGYHNIDGLSSWDGSAIFDAGDQKWHLFNTILRNHCGIEQWLSNSYIAHLVSNSSDIMGPYMVKDVPLQVFNDSNSVNKYWDAVSVFNPYIISNKSVTNNNNNNNNNTKGSQQTMYYLFYTGTTETNGTNLHCSSSNIIKKNVGIVNKTQLQINQRIGAAYSTSLYGPWTRFPNNPILDVIPNVDNNDDNYNTRWDSLYVTNPSPYVLHNGTLILIYKGKSSKSSGMHTGYAIVNGNQWNDTYFRYNYSSNVAGSCEDGFFWEVSLNNNNSISSINSNSSSSYHMLYHCGCNALHGYSNDLIQWVYNKEQPWCNITLNNGTEIVLKLRQRPFLVFSNDSTVQVPATTNIFNAAQGPKGPAFNLVQSL